MGLTYGPIPLILLDMFEKEELLFYKISGTLVESVGLEIPVLSAGRFVITPSCQDDIREGFIRRTAKIITPALSKMLLMYLNDIDVLDSYIEDSGSDSLDVYRDQFLEKMTADSCGELRGRVPQLIELIRKIHTQYIAVIDEFILRVDNSYDVICSSLLHNRFSELSGKLHPVRCFFPFDGNGVVLNRTLYCEVEDGIDHLPAFIQRITLKDVLFANNRASMNILYAVF